MQSHHARAGDIVDHDVVDGMMCGGRCWMERESIIRLQRTAPDRLGVTERKKEGCMDIDANVGLLPLQCIVVIVNHVANGCVICSFFDRANPLNYSHLSKK